MSNTDYKISDIESILITIQIKKLFKVWFNGQNENVLIIVYHHGNLTLQIARTFAILKLTDKRIMRALRERDKVEGALARYVVVQASV